MKRIHAVSWELALTFGRRRRRRRRRNFLRSPRSCGLLSLNAANKKIDDTRLMTKLMKDKSTWKHHIRFFSHDFPTWSFAAAVEHPAIRTIPNLIDGGDGAEQQQTTVPKKARTRTWQQERWKQRYQELAEYKKGHGHCNVSKGSIQEYKQLGAWVKTQRSEYSKGRMPQDRMKQLNDIGFDWDPLASQWNKMFHKLVEYNKHHGDCRVSQWSMGYKQLGRWVKEQRFQFKKLQTGKDSFMTEERIVKLDSVGFVWSPFDALWEERFEQLREYQKVYKHCNVPKNYDFKLALWVQAQRRQYRKFVNSERTSMSEERIDKLESIGFEWNPDGNGTMEQENVHFGDAIVERGDNTLRFLFQNPNGISSVNNFDQAGQYGSNLKIFNVDVACLCETKTDFSKGGVLEAIEGQLHQTWSQRIILQHSSSNDTFASIAQPGGTLTVVTGDCISDIRSTDHDSRGLGRWSTVTFGGNDEQQLTIINSYRVCNQRESAGETTTYMQQVRLLQKEGMQNPDPRQEHLNDLSECIGQYKDRGHEIILVIDANEILRPGGGKLTKFVEELDLREPIKERFASDTNPIPSTYWRGSNQIDFMFTTKGIDEYIRRCGYLQFNQVLRSDHRGIFFDLDLDGFLGRSTLSRDLFLPMILPSPRKDTL